MPRQLLLFDLPASASRPVARWSRKLDRVEVCTGCGRTIIAQRFTRDGVMSEFQDAAGRCWRCNKPAR